MATSAGVWIDHKQAIVVLVTGASQQVRKFETAVDSSSRPASSRSKAKYTPNDFIAEDKRDRKLASARKIVYDKVLGCIRGAKAMLILGPGEIKGEFAKHIKSKKLRGIAVEMETADKMTDRQLATKVSEHFTKSPTTKPNAKSQTTLRRKDLSLGSKIPASKSVASKKVNVAKTKAKAAPGKHLKKPAK